MDGIVTIDQLADLFKIQPLALIIVSALITALTELLKSKIVYRRHKWLQGNKILLVPVIAGIGIAFLIPDIPFADRLRVGVLSAFVSVIGWELIKSVASKIKGVT